MPKRILTKSALSVSVLALAACGGADAPSDPVAGAKFVSNRAASMSLACTGCHSEQAGAIASLTNYSETALKETLELYKNETDGTTVMHRLARGYSDEEITLISAYLGAPEGGE